MPSGAPRVMRSVAPSNTSGGTAPVSCTAAEVGLPLRRARCSDAASARAGAGWRRACARCRPRPARPCRPSAPGSSSATSTSTRVKPRDAGLHLSSARGWWTASAPARRPRWRSAHRRGGSSGSASAAPPACRGSCGRAVRSRSRRRRRSGTGAASRRPVSWLSAHHCAARHLGQALRVVGQRTGGLDAGAQRDGDDGQRHQHLDQREAARAPPVLHGAACRRR